MNPNCILDEMKSLEESLICEVCNKVLNVPLLIVKCGHTACKCCFMNRSGNTCPICNIPVTSKDSLEDKQLTELLIHLKELQGIFQDDTGEDVVQHAEKDNETEESLRDIHQNRKKEQSTPVCSTSRLTRTKLLSKISSTPSNGDASIIHETSENECMKTPTIPVGRSKKTGNRKLSSSTSSPNTSIQSPVGNINKKNHKGETFLHRAVIKGDMAKVLDFLNDGALVNTQDNNGWTPLHEASNHGFVEIAKLLLDHGALVNVPSLKDNITPLHDALLNYQIPMAILLVSRGADLHAKTSFGYTSLDLCKTDEDRNILIEACSPFIEANTIFPDTKVATPKIDKLVLLSSNLNDDQKLKLQKCAQMLKADIIDDFNLNVTHIITCCDDMGNCTRTMKILMGILTGKWLLNYQWIEVCLEYKQKVEEEVFEVQGMKNQPNTQGPKRGRQNYEQKFPPLFHGFNFYLYGNFTKPTPEREDLCNLVHFGGGKILSREPRQEAVSNEPYMIPYHAVGTALEAFSHVILFQDKPPRDIHIHTGHICTTQVMWLISCISEFQVLNLRQTNISNK